MKQQCYEMEEKLAMYSRLTKLGQFPSCYNFELTLNSRGLFKNVSITIIFYYVKKCCSNTGKCFPPKNDCIMHLPSLVCTPFLGFTEQENILGAGVSVVGIRYVLLLCVLSKIHSVQYNISVTVIDHLSP